MFRHKLGLDNWHYLCISKSERFVPVVSEPSIWQILRSDRFTTPILRSWMPWLINKMRAERYLEGCTGFGCNAGILFTDSARLDELIQDGLRNRRITI